MIYLAPQTISCGERILQYILARWEDGKMATRVPISSEPGAEPHSNETEFRTCQFLLHEPSTSWA